MMENNNEHISPRLIRLIRAIGTETLTRRGICGNMGVRARKNLWDNYMTPAMTQGYIKMLYSEHPNSPDQAYYLTEKGMKVYNEHKDDKIVDGPTE